MNRNKPIVLALCSWYPNRLDPTLGNFIHEHLELLAEDVDLRAVFVTGDIEVTQSDWVEPNLPKYRAICGYIPGKRNVWKPFALFAAWKQGAIKVLDGKQPNFIHVHSVWPAIIPAYFLSKKWQVPILLSEHWTGFLPEQNQPIGWFKKIVLRYLMPKCAIITAVGKPLAQALQEWAPRVPITVIPNALGAAFFNLKHESPSHPTFLHVSNGSKQKNLKWLISLFFEFATHHPSAILTIVGEEGEDKIWARNQAKMHPFGKQLVFYNVIEPYALADLMKRSTSLLHPAIYETQGLTVFEAAAVGLPIIANDLEPFETLAEFGLFLPINDRHAWLLAMAQMMEGTYQKRANTFPSVFQPEQVKQQWLHLYQEMETYHA